MSRGRTGHPQGTRIPGRMPGSTDPDRNIVAELHSEVGEVEAGFRDADFIYEEAYRIQRVATRRAGDPRRDRLDGRGPAAPGPYLHPGAVPGPAYTGPPVRAPRGPVRVIAGRLGGGFGGKQEVLTEDIVALAALKLRRPVQLEFTRSEQFTASTTRHPFTIRLKAAASTEGKLTALQLEVLTNTGAYGNHSVGVMFHGCGESLGVYNCANKKVDAHAVYTNTLPAGAFFGYGLSQMIFAVESAIDEVAIGSRDRSDGIPAEKRRRRGRPDALDVRRSRGGRAVRQLRLDQCTRLAEDALARGRDRYREAGHDDLGPDWVTGEGWRCR